METLTITERRTITIRSKIARILSILGRKLENELAVRHVRSETETRGSRSDLTAIEVSTRHWRQWSGDIGYGRESRWLPITRLQRVNSAEVQC